MKLVSFNVNSVRIRMPQLEALKAAHQPAIVGLQETKVTDGDYPLEPLTELGYESCYFGQKTHYGVAILSTVPPVTVHKGFSTDEDDAQRRFIAADYALTDGRVLHVLNGYFPQGEARDNATKFPAKERYYADLFAYIKTNFTPQDLLVVMGDFNVAPQDIDIGIGAANAKRWLRDGKTSFLPEERSWFEGLIAWGLKDSFRMLHPEEDDLFSWFDYRSKGFDREPKRGLRIDHLLVSEGLQSSVKAAGIEYSVRGMERPSDHCPAWLELEGLELLEG